MFCKLSIKNFAIIDDLNISFSDGLTVLSGETGAGKSIIINAVNLLLGSRASSKLIRTGAEHQGLLKEELHLQLLDQFGNLTAIKNKIYKIFYEITSLFAKLKKLEKIQADKDKQFELMQFQQQEIENTEIIIGEDKQLELEINRLKNSKALYKTVLLASRELHSSNGSISERLNIISKNMEKAVEMDPNLEKDSESLIDIRFKIEDIAETMQTYLRNINMDNHTLEEAQTRLDILQKLKRKYGGSLESIFEHLDKINSELSGSENRTHDINRYKEKLANLHGKISTLAEELSSKRKQLSQHFNHRVEEELASLKMAGTVFKISISDNKIDAKTDNNINPYLMVNGIEINETGFNRAVFMMAPNPGEALKPLAQTASGGELSRVVLALKAMLAEVDSVETVVFDEVDSGIGGGVAEIVGQKLKKLSQYHQIICITHLGQIAKFATSHYKIVKNVINGRTSTSILPMDKKQRIEEIARMIGGVKITQKTIEHAKELLMNS